MKNNKNKVFKPRNIRLEHGQMVLVSIEDLVKEEHPLYRIRNMYDWEKLSKPFKKCFKGEKECGPKGYPVSILFRMNFLSFLYEMSDKETETYVSDSFIARYFVGLNLTDPIPDETTLCRFRGRIVEHKQTDLLEKINNDILNNVIKRGVAMGKIQILDSTHTESLINRAKEKHKNKILKEKGEKPLPPKDPDASTIHKGKKKVVNSKTGETIEIDNTYYGYKCHVSLNQATGLVTSFDVSTGSSYDNNYAIPLIDMDIKKGFKPTVVTADKAYDDGDFHYYLERRNILSAVILKKNRTNHKDERLNEKWKELEKNPIRKKAKKCRYKVERKFAETKNRHGFSNCRYIGLAKYKFQAFMTILVVNIKRILKIMPKRQFSDKQIFKIAS